MSIPIDFNPGPKDRGFLFSGSGGVRSSSPALEAGARWFESSFPDNMVCVAQLGERWFVKPKVARSKLVVHPTCECSNEGSCGSLKNY